MRYFTIFYMLNVHSSDYKKVVPVFGSMALNSNDYPNNTLCQNYLKRELQADIVHIINVIELSKEDYESWIK